MSIMMYTLRQIRNSPYSPAPLSNEFFNLRFSSDDKLSPRMKEFKKKLREKSPIGKLDEPLGKHPYEEDQPLEPWPNNTNPHTGEIGGPRGPEPTSYSLLPKSLCKQMQIMSSAILKKLHKMIDKMAA